MQQRGHYDEYGTRITSVQDQEAIALYGLMERHVRQGEDEGRAQAAALLEDGALQQTVSVQVLGDERLITGETVVVEEPETGLQGIFWIDADSHTWARGQYTCRLTLNCRSVMATAGAGSNCERSDSMSRDPYLGIMGLMDDTAKSRVPTWCCLGEVIKAEKEALSSRRTATS